MKKLIGLGLIILVSLGTLYSYFRGQSEPDKGLSIQDLKIREIDKNNETDYAVAFAIRFRPKGAPERKMLVLDGVLTKFSQSDERFVTQWNSVGRYIADGKPGSEEVIKALIGQQSISDQQGDQLEHYLSPNFPKAFLRTQLMILDRFFIKVPIDSRMTVTKDEVDDLVPFTAEYSFAQDQGLSVVTKKWAGYKNASSSVDPSDHSIRYYYDANKQLLGAQGRVKSYFKDQDESELVIDFQVKSIATRPASPRFKSLEIQGLRLADSGWLRDAVGSPQNLGSTLADALRDVETLTEATDGGKTYEIFRALTDQVRANPEVAQQLSRRILEIKERDPASRRKLSALFGALAESKSSEGADTLAELAKDCPDSYCKTQAIMGLNTHSQPSPNNTEAMLSIARTADDKGVAATALIAAGAIGRKLEGESPDLTRELIQSYSNPANAEMKTSALAAMGNHGSADYWPTLSGGLKSSDSNIRSAAVYSLRHLPNEEVNAEIIRVIDQDDITSVVSEALKASGFRQMKTEEYNHIANRAANFKNKELAEQAANLLAEVYRSNPAAGQEALNVLREKTKYPDVKKYIEAQMKGAEAPKP